jgi:hypothetical protein
MTYDHGSLHCVPQHLPRALSALGSRPYRTPDGKQKWPGGYRTKEDAQEQVDIILGIIRENS